MGNDALVGCSVPGGNRRGELQPGCTQVHMVRYWRSGQTIDARSHPFEDSVCRREPLERRIADAASGHLTARDKTPLVLSQILKSIEDRGAMHYCIVPPICGVIQYRSSGELQLTPCEGGIAVFM